MEEMWLTGGKMTPSHGISGVRQAQFILAIMVLVGVILGNSVSQWFYLLDILVGMNLLVASLSAACPLTGLLNKLPWNQPLTK